MRLEQGRDGSPDGVRFSKGAQRLLQQAEGLGVNTQPYLARLDAQLGRVCVKGPLAGLREAVLTVRANRGVRR